MTEAEKKTDAASPSLETMKSDEWLTTESLLHLRRLVPVVYLFLCPLDTCGQSISVKDAGRGRMELVFEAHHGTELVCVSNRWQVSMKGQAHRVDPGEPDLPFFVHARPCTPGQGLDVVTVEADFQVVTQGIDVATVAIPSLDRGWPESTVREAMKRRDELRALDAFWPQPVISVTEAWQGRQKLLHFTIRPVQYHPRTRTLRQCTRLKARLRVVPSKDIEGPRGPVRPRPKASPNGPGRTGDAP